MKKKLILFVMLIVSLFIYSERAEAAKELTCIYSGESDESRVMLFQEANGTLGVIFGNNSLSDVSLDYIDSPAWYYNDILNDINNGKLHYELKVQFNTSSYDLSTKSLNGCPNNYNLDHPSGVAYVYGYGGFLGYQYYNYNFFDSDDNMKLLASYNRTPKKINYRFSTSDNYSEKIANTKWDAKCKYDNVNLFFNKNELLLFSSVSVDEFNFVSQFSLDELFTAYSGVCPVIMYTEVIQEYNYETKELNRSKLFFLSDTGSHSSNKIKITSKDYGNDVNGNDNNNVDTCESLLGDDLIEKIVGFFNIIKIAIPILLIGFGIFDFAKAVFGNDENMKKVKKTFILRIVAAILFFLSPILIKFILSLANSVWDFINPSTCL